MKYTLLLLFCYMQSLPLAAQPSGYEQQMVQLADGSDTLLWINLDEKTELLQYKSTLAGMAVTFKPADVVSFRYNNNYYYSLPLRDDYFTFFKVYHEGTEYAVLEKTPSYKTLRIVADESGGGFSLCQSRRKDEFYLCIRDYNSNSSLNNPFGASSGVREFQVTKLVYLAIEGKLKLFYMETDERFNFWDDWMGPRPGQRRVEKMMEDFIEDPEKLAIIQKKIKKDKLDVRIPHQLIKALEAVYK